MNGGCLAHRNQAPKSKIERGHHLAYQSSRETGEEQV